MVDDVLSSNELKHARADVESLEGFGTAIWQQGGSHQGGDRVRADTVSWLLEDGLGVRTPMQGLATALRRLRGVASELAESEPPSTSLDASTTSAPGCWPGFDQARHEVSLGVPLACQLASYEATAGRDPVVDGRKGGANGDGQAAIGYVPHRDGLPVSRVPRWSRRAFEKLGTSSREISALLYLNHAGAFADHATGGELVLYLGADDDDDVGVSCSERVQVLPTGGRLVLFDSRRVLHEVLPHSAASSRLALTCWIGGRWSLLP